MRSTLISDAHLQGDDARQRRLVDFVDRWQTDELVLVGDIFDAWYGWDSVVYSAYLPFIEALARKHRQGVSLVFVPGNHDFAVGGALAEYAGVQAQDRWRRDTGGRRVVAVHGDQAHNPLSQRAFNWFLRGRGARAVMRLVGPDAGWRMASHLASRNRRNGMYTAERLAALLDAQARWAVGVLRDEEASLVFVGHTHAPGIAEVDGGQLVNLGDWVDHCTFAVVDDASVQLLRWTGDEAVPVPHGPPARRSWANGGV